MNKHNIAAASDAAADPLSAVASLRASLSATGFWWIPLYNWDTAWLPEKYRGKRPKGAAWQECVRRDPSAEAAPEPDALNTGILCDGLRAVDVDIDDADTAARVRALAVARLGEAPMRWRENSPRVLLLYRAVEGEPPKRIVAGTAGKVEVLGKGQQFVAFGTHASGAALHWQGEAPGICTREALPAVSEAQIDAFLTAAREVIGAPEGRSTAGSKAEKQKAGTDVPPHRPSAHGPSADPLDVVAALLVIPNDGPADWEFWNKIGMAVWAATGGSMAGYDAWYTWSEKHPEHDPAACRERWEHYATSPPDQIGAGTLFHLAREAQPGWRKPSARPERSETSSPATKVNPVIQVLLEADVTFWHDPDGRCYATVPDGGTLKRYRINSREFSATVRSLFGARKFVIVEERKIPNVIAENAMREAVATCESLALDGPKREPGVRTVLHDDSVWIDLGRTDWSLVQVSREGWEIVRSADVPLIRPSGMRPLPVPERTKAPAAHLLPYQLPLGLPAAQLRLVFGFLTAALLPKGPYPLLAVDGEHGSGKSYFCRMLRQFVDPNKAPLSSPPKDEEDLIIAAQNGAMVGLDNMSVLAPRLADALCRLATGGGLRKRALYTDDDEYVISVCRPVLLNGIPNLLARPDLADRAIAITLPPIRQRATEAELKTELETYAPQVLGLLLDGLATALRRMPGLKLEPRTRMADFAHLVCAAAPAFGWTEQEMAEALEQNSKIVTAAALDADPVAQALFDLAARKKWSGTAAQLLDALEERVPYMERRQRGEWPGNARALSVRLRRLAPALRQAGLDVSLPGTGGRKGRPIEVRPTAQAAAAV